MSEGRQEISERAHWLGQELFDLDDQIKATEGYRIHLKIRALRSSCCIFERNYRWLVTALDYFGRREVFMELWREANRTRLESFLDEVTRLLHNFLAGAQSLVDHTRVFKNKMYKGHRFKKVYQEKVDRDLKHSPIACFVQDLRNYVLHKQLPIASAQLSFKGGGGTITEFDSTIKLDVNELRKGISGNLRVAYISIRWTTRCRFGKWSRSTRALSGPFISGSVSNRHKCTTSKPLTPSEDQRTGFSLALPRPDALSSLPAAPPYDVGPRIAYRHLYQAYRKSTIANLSPCARMYRSCITAGSCKMSGLAIKEETSWQN